TLGHDGPVRCVAISADDPLFSTKPLVSTCGVDGLVKVWYAATGKRLHEFKGHTRRVNPVAFRPQNDNPLLTASDDGTVRIWHVPEGTGPKGRDLERWADAKGPLTGLAFSHTEGGGPFGLVWSSDQSGCIRAWDLNSGRLVKGKTLSHPGVLGIAAAADRG